MNIFASLFGIFRKRGLVSTIKEGKSLVNFVIFGVIISISGNLLYGFAMGIGMGVDTAVKDAIKLGLIATLVLLLALPIFWIAFRLLGRDESFDKIAAIPITLVTSVSIILAVTAPVVFFLSLLIGFSSEAVYIHIVIVNLAILVGLYLGGTLAYHSFNDQRRLVIPNVIGFLMMGVTLIILMSFFNPLLTPYSTFSVGTDRLMDGLGIGVEEKVNQSLDAASTTERVKYRFTTTNNNGDVQQDYSIFRNGDDYLIDIHLHAVPGEPIFEKKHIWILDGTIYTDFENGFVNTANRAGLKSILENALPPIVFSTPSEFKTASWRAVEAGGKYTVTGSTPSLQQATLTMDSRSNRISEFKLGSAEQGINAEIRVSNITASEFNRSDLEESLNRAIAVGTLIDVVEKVDRSLAAASTADRINYRFQTTNENGDLMQDYTVTRIGDDYLIEIHLHAVLGETFQQTKNIWVLDNITYTDFNEGVVLQEDPNNLSSFLDVGLPSVALTLPKEFESATWRGFEKGNQFIATGTTQSLSEITLVMDAVTGRLSDLTLGVAESELHAEVRVKDIVPAKLDREGLEANLNQAIVVGSVDRFDASMQDYIQGEVFFVVRYPRNWRSGTWSLSNKSIEFKADCTAELECPSLRVTVFDLVEGKGPRQYSEDLAESLSLQPEYREITTGAIKVGDQTVGVVEYLFDQVEAGEIQTSHHIEYIFEGQLSRYHMEFSTPDSEFETFRNLFAEMAELFTYLRK